MAEQPPGDPVCRPSQPVDHRLARIRRLGWGVTLWGGLPNNQGDRLHDAVRRGSARYAEFGPFYIGYIQPAADAIAHLKL
ncbi:MAG: hypothetical protein CM1200mP2_31730 [Planctomycetaceae bacterium]|nr:MAG: hypothetical protein CM1200mP2_31730 [Planctomycetaceae bacterium]